MKSKDMTINQFNKRFPTDEACLRELYLLRYGNKHKCEKCGRVGMFRKVTGRKQFVCPCGKFVAPTAGTIFHKSATPLKDWFYVMYMMSTTRNGVSAKEVERQLGCTYKTAWRMCNKIRGAMDTKKSLSGVVEIDDAYIGGKKRGKRGRGADGKTIVVGAVERKGRATVKVVKNLQQKTVKPFVKETITEGTTVYTDEMGGYRFIPREGYQHDTVTHAAKEYVRGAVHTNSIEGFWSHLKRGIKGTHIWVSAKHLQKYADEFAFRYNQRTETTPIFHRLLLHLSQPVSVSP